MNALAGKFWKNYLAGGRLLDTKEHMGKFSA